MTQGENQKLILVLDNDQKMTRRVQKRLSDKPRYRVEQTGCYEDAYHKVKEGLVDLLFYQVGKALDDGVDHLDRMKDANPDVPVVVSALLDFPPPPAAGKKRD